MTDDIQAHVEGAARGRVARKPLLKGIRRVVVKLGSRVVAVDDNGLNLDLIGQLAVDVATVRESGIQVTLVSSGAVAAGMGRLEMQQRPARIPDLQAAAAVGQGLLMNAYNSAFKELEIPIGQVLLTMDDLGDRWRYVNAQNTLNALIGLGAVPVVNENDSVAVEENKVGDNDRLSAMVAHLVDADLLIVLTDVDGLFSGDPGSDPDSRLIPCVERVTPELISRAGKAGSAVSLGGMRTKLQAAESVTRAGRMMVITNGHTTRIPDVLDGAEAGTLFLASKEPLVGRKIWIANMLKKGVVVVDAGAVEAISRRGKSLLPPGVVKVVGDFEAGELIAVEGPTGEEVARGVVQFGSAEIRQILGRQTSEIAGILGVTGNVEVIHRDDMVTL